MNVYYFPYDTIVETIKHEVIKQSPWITKLDCTYTRDRIYNMKNTMILKLEPKFWSTEFPDNMMLSEEIPDSVFEREHLGIRYCIDWATSALEDFANTHPALEKRREQIRWCYKNCQQRFHPLGNIEAVKTWDNGGRMLIRFDDPDDEVIFRLMWL